MSVVFGFCLALEGFCIFSSPRMDRVLVFFTTVFSAHLADLAASPVFM